MFPPRVSGDVLSLGGAAAAGCGLQYVRETYFAGEDKTTTAMIVDAAVAGAAMMGASQFRGDMAPLMEGVMLGAVAHLGTLACGFAKKLFGVQVRSYPARVARSAVLPAYTVPTYRA